MKRRIAPWNRGQDPELAHKHSSSGWLWLRRAVTDQSFLRPLTIKWDLFGRSASTLSGKVSEALWVQRGSVGHPRRTTKAQISQTAGVVDSTDSRSRDLCSDEGLRADGESSSDWKLNRFGPSFGNNPFRERQVLVGAFAMFLDSDQDLTVTHGLVVVVGQLLLIPAG